MKTKRRLILTLALIGIIFGCAASISAQNALQPTGSFNSIETTDKEVVAAADFAVKKQSKAQKGTIKLVAVNHAARQIVAGTNYQICLSVESLDGKSKTPTPQTVQAVVHRNLKGKHKLTSWAIAACTDAAPVAAPVK